MSHTSKSSGPTPPIDLADPLRLLSSSIADIGLLRPTTELGATTHLC